MLMIVRVRISPAVKLAGFVSVDSLSNRVNVGASRGTLIAVMTRKSITAEALHRGQAAWLNGEWGASATYSIPASPPHEWQNQRYMVASSTIVPAGSARILSELNRYFG